MQYDKSKNDRKNTVRQRYIFISFYRKLSMILTIYSHIKMSKTIAGKGTIHNIL